jgi:drug/metabolite transporter (DMT)-like permease
MLGPWMHLALLSAVFDATRNTLVKDCCKRDSLKDVNAYMFALSIPYYIIMGAIINDLSFNAIVEWPFLALHIVLEIGANIALTRALSQVNLSTVIPILSSSILFVVIPGYIWGTKEYTPLGIGACLSIALGIIALAKHAQFEGVSKQWIVNKTGLMLGLFVAILWAIDGVALGHISRKPGWPIFLAISNIFVSIFFFIKPFTLKYKPVLERGFLKYLILGGASAMSLGFMMLAMGHANGPVGYVIAVKRVSVLFGVLSGIFFFREKVSAFLILGAFLILAGSAGLALIGGH